MDLGAEMIVLPKFPIATARNPSQVFYDGVTVWAVTNRQALVEVMESLPNK